LLASVPLLAGSLLELPLGVLAGEGRRRRLAALAGGIVFVLTLLGAASARSFAVLLCVLVAFYPASGAFVGLTQADLMDRWPNRQAQVMARWELAGSTGAVAGPLLLAAVLASGGGWRDTYLALAGLAALAWLGLCLRGPHGADADKTDAADADDADETDAAYVADVDETDAADADDADETDAADVAKEAVQAGGAAGDAGGAAEADAGEMGGAAAEAAVDIGAGEGRLWRVRGREVLAALRDWGTVRWLVLLQVADLLVDVFTGFLALYLVDVEHLRPAVAALAIAIRLGASLAGGGALIAVLERVGDLTVLRATAVAAALLYPGFLLVPGVVPKLAILAVLSAATAPWYPLLQARLYGSLPGRSPVAVTLSSAAALAGGLGPLAVGLAAQAFGLPWAMAGLAVVPVVVLAVSASARAGAGARVD
jgi:predicted MFS family arabinose efflux permease